MDSIPAAEPLNSDEVRGLKHFKRLLPLFQRLHEVGCQRDKAHNRRLYFDDYCAVVMLYLFNPLVNSLRRLQETLELPNVIKALGIKRFSLGSFSEAPRAFEPEQLQGIIHELAGELRPLSTNPRLPELKHALTLVDSTVLGNLPRLASAACEQTRCTTGRDGRAIHGWRLHMQLDLQTFTPHRTQRTGARNAGENRENNVLRHNLEPGLCYVGDGGYADRTLFDDIVRLESCYVIRLRTDSVFDVQEERLLSQAALDAGVVRDAVVRLGGQEAQPMSHSVRLVMVQVQPHPRRTRKGVQHTDVLLIATSLLDLPAELVAMIYLCRYTVELFFRFFKHLLGMRHLLSQRETGVDIQVYCAVIACLLISLQTARNPNKSTLMMIGWYLLGVATEDDVLRHLNKPDNRGVKLAAKDALWKKMGF